MGSHQLTEDDAKALAKKGLALYDSHLDSNSDVLRRGALRGHERIKA